MYLTLNSCCFVYCLVWSTMYYILTSSFNTSLYIFLFIFILYLHCLHFIVLLACVVLMSLYIIVKYLKYYCLARLCYCTMYKVCLCHILDISYLSKFGFHFLLREVVCEQCYISVQYLK